MYILTLEMCSTHACAAFHLFAQCAGKTPNLGCRTLGNFDDVRCYGILLTRSQYPKNAELSLQTQSLAHTIPKWSEPIVEWFKPVKVRCFRVWTAKASSALALWCPSTMRSEDRGCHTGRCDTQWNFLQIKSYFFTTLIQNRFFKMLKPIIFGMT